MNVVKRKPTWRSDFSRYITAARRKPFVLGEHDCGLFPASAIEAMTGFDFAIDLRGKYDSFPTAIRRLKELGFNTHEDMAASLFEEIHPSSATLGDVCAFDVDDEMGVALGMCNGEISFVLRPDGIGVLQTLTARSAFRV